MRILPAITVPINDAVKKLFILARNDAYKFEGSYITKAYTESLFTCVLQVKDKVAYVIITGASGFICHPRTANNVTYHLKQDAILKCVDGGWAYDGENTLVELDAKTNSFVFPLLDIDNASTALTGSDKIDSIEFLSVESNYGNLYWHNGDSESIISYKGTPTKHFAFGVSVDGIDNAYYSYGTVIYKSGLPLVKVQAGLEIFGAAVYNNYAIYISRIGLFWCDLNAVNESFEAAWIKIDGAYKYDPLDVQWFFDSTGLNAVSSCGNLIQIQKDLTEYTYLSGDNTKGTRIVSGDSSENSVTYTYDGKKYFEYLDDKIVNCSVSISSRINSRSKVSSVTNYFTFSNVKWINPPDMVDMIVTSNNICASFAPIRSDGTQVGGLTGWGTCPDMQPTVVFSGPVVKDESNPTCAIIDPLEITCSATSYTLTVGAVVSYGGVVAAGEVDIAVTANPNGYWKITSCSGGSETENIQCAYYLGRTDILTQSSSYLRSQGWTVSDDGHTRRLTFRNSTSCYESVNCAGYLQASSLCSSFRDFSATTTYDPYCSYAYCASEGIYKQVCYTQSSGTYLAYDIVQTWICL